MTSERRYALSGDDGADAWTRAVVDASPVPTVALDREGRVILWNPAATHILGWRPGEVLGRSLPTVPTEDREAFDVLLGRVLLGERIADLDLTHRHRDGGHVDLSVSLVPLLDPDGAVIGAVVTLLDVTRAKRFAADQRRIDRERDGARALSDTERARWNAVLMQAPAAIAVLRGPDHRFELANPRFAALVGAQEYVGRPVQEVLSYPEAQEIVALIDTVYGSGQPYIGNEIPFPTHPSSDAPDTPAFNLVVEPMRDPYGHVDGVIVHAVDVTDGVRSRERAERLAAERATILSQIADGVILTDAQGAMRYMNEAARRMLGAPPVGENLSTYLGRAAVRDGDGNPIAIDRLALVRALEHGETTVDAFRRVERPGHPDIYVSTSVAPIINDNGERLGAVVTMRDVTQQREIEQQRDDILSSAVHDLKNPLAAVLGSAQLVLRRAKGHEVLNVAEVMRDMDRIVLTTRRMARLITDLVDVSRIESDRPLDIERRSTDLIALVREAIATHQALDEGREVRVVTELPELRGMWDEFRLERVVENLVGNAVKYSPQETAVEIAVRRTPTHAVLTVTDHGIGIPAADRPRIFDRYFRASNVGGMTPGTGIGLLSSKRIVEELGGEIQIESEEGVGTVVTVLLPLADLPA